jgi:hypothetical protein
MVNVFRMKAMTLMGQLSKIDGAEFSYRYEQGCGPIMEVYHKKEFHIFVPTGRCLREMDQYLDELTAQKKESFPNARKARKNYPLNYNLR